MSTAKTVTVYKNGDTHFAGRKVVLNNREIKSLDTLLDKFTKVVRYPVAVRSIQTPTNGTRVIGLTDLENGREYVAVGPEGFKRVKYKDIQNSRVPWASKGPAAAPPPLPGRSNKVYSNVTARHKQVGEEEARRNRIIIVYRNADENHAGIRMLLDKRTLLSLDNVFEFITKKVKLQSGAVRKLYTLEGRLIDTVSAIQTGGQYVAVGDGKKFKDLDYPNLKAPSAITPRKMNPVAKKTKLKAPKGKTKTSNQDAWKEHKKKQSLATLPVDNDLSYNEEPLSPRADSDDNHNDSNDGYDDSPSNDNVDSNNNYFDSLIDKIDDALDGDNSDSNQPEQPSPSKRPVVETDPEKVFGRAVDSTKSKTSAQKQNTSRQVSDDVAEPILDDEPATWRKSVTPAGSRLSQASNRTRKISDGKRDVSSKARSIHEEAAADLANEVEERSTENVKKLYDEDNAGDDNFDDIPDDSLDAANNPVAEDSLEKDVPEDLAVAEDDDAVPYDADNENDEPPAPGVYQASGIEAETAADINDSGDTTVEKTIDELPAEEIEEEVEDVEGVDSQSALDPALATTEPNTARDDDQVGQ